MKILMIDQAGFQLQTRKMLIEEAIEKCSVDIALTLGEVFIAFQKDKFDVVVIDHGIENGQQCVDHILQLDPNQAILVVSDAIHCVVSRCEDCVNNYAIRRLFNPTPIKNIVRLIEGFRNYRCDHYDNETNKIKK
jgi:predicted O-methyltransferase YrrM